MYMQLGNIVAKKLTFECNAEDVLSDLFNYLDENEIIDIALSIPLIKMHSN